MRVCVLYEIIMEEKRKKESEDNKTEDNTCRGYYKKKIEKNKRNKRALKENK